MGLKAFVFFKLRSCLHCPSTWELLNFDVRFDKIPLWSQYKKVWHVYVKADILNKLQYVVSKLLCSVKLSNHPFRDETTFLVG